MKHKVIRTGIGLIALLVVITLVGVRSVNAESNHSSVNDPRYHRAQATQHRQEAARLQGAIERYQIMMMVYSMGSDSTTGTYNPQGRRAMVERTSRTLAYFVEQKIANEQQAAEHETLAQMLPER